MSRCQSIAGLFLALVVMGTSGNAATPVYVEVQSQVNIGFFGTYGTTPPQITAAGPTAILLYRNQGNGAAVGDYDGDGDLDIYLLGQLGESNQLLRNDLDLGTKWFTNVTTVAGVADFGMSRVAHFADLDNDGDLDLLVVNDDDGTTDFSPSRVFENNGNGTFDDKTATANFAPQGYLRCGAALADYDRDGLLDVYVTNWGAGGGGPPVFPGSNRLYRNLGNFVFQDVTAAVGLGTLDRDSFTAIFHDFDGDDYPDLFVAIDHTSDEFYWNQNGTFVNDTAGVGTTHLGNDMGVACVDFDDDGDLDLYATNITDPNGLFGTNPYNVLNVNLEDTLGSTQFVDEAVLQGVEDTFWGWGVEFVDWDYDGDLDIVAATGYDEFIEAINQASTLYRTPTVYLENISPGLFSRVYSPPLSEAKDSRALIAFDYDRDGDEDLLITNVSQPTLLLENQTPSQRHWLALTAIQAAGSNRNAVGASAYATVGSVTRRRDFIMGDSYLSGSPTEVYFGLGGTNTAQSVEMHWTDGSQTTYQNVYGDRLIQVTQGVADVDLDGTLDQDDCSSPDGSTWAVPAPIEDLMHVGGSDSDLIWSLTYDSGSFVPDFDVVRSTSRDMSTAFTCLASAISDTTVADSGIPPGTIYYYGVRTRNGCGQNEGLAQIPRSWGSCP